MSFFADPSNVILIVSLLMLVFGGIFGVAIGYVIWGMHPTIVEVEKKSQEKPQQPQGTETAATPAPVTGQLMNDFVSSYILKDETTYEIHFASGSIFICHKTNENLAMLLEAQTKGWPLRYKKLGGARNYISLTGTIPLTT